MLISLSLSLSSVCLFLSVSLPLSLLLIYIAGHLFMLILENEEKLDRTVQVYLSLSFCLSVPLSLSSLTFYAEGCNA